MKHHFRFLRILLPTIALFFGLTAMASAQEINGSIVGSVKDTNGAAVKGATVTITDSEKKIVVRTATTDDEGGYAARDLHVGTYEVAVEAAGFKKHVESKVQVDVGTPRSLSINLEVGNVSEVVTVEANPVAVELSTPTVSTVISGDQARELSLNNRNWVQLITLAPGVSNDLADQVYVGTTNPAGQANLMNISVNGARSAQNTYTIDGADVTDRGSNITIQAYPSVDSIAEFKVQRSLFAAESGRSGGGQINVVTRGGGDKFHGSGFEFLRNEKLNANDFISNRFTPTTATPNPPFGRDTNGKAKRSPFRYNNYGFTVGGPVYLWKRIPRTYFFFSEEQRKDRRYPTLNSTVPDTGMRSGVFPVDICLSASIATTTPTIAPANCTSVLPANTAMSSALISPVAQQYLDLIYKKLPLPTDAFSRALTYPASGRADFRQEIIRFDRNFSDKVSAYYRYERDKIPTIDVNSLFSSGSSLPGVSTSATDSPGRTHTAQVTYIANSGLVIVGRWTYGYGAILSNTIGTMALSNSPITPPLPYTKTRDFVPTVSGNGFGGLATFGDYDNFSYKHNFAGDVSWTKGTHTLKFGGVYSYYRKNENALGGANHGTFSGFLNTTLTSAQQSSVRAPNALTQAALLGGTAAQQSTLVANLQLWSNFLMGNNITFSQARFDLTADMRQIAVESYAQDEWRFRRNLTVYYGVRHSYFGSPYDRNGFLSNFDPSTYTAATAPLVTGAGNRVAGTGNFCDGLIINSQNPKTLTNCTPTISPYGKYVVKAPKGDFAPRIGLAWDPFKKGTTSIRMGYGMYYDQVLNGTYEQNIGVNPPYQETCTFSLSSLASPVPTGSACPPGAAATGAPNLRALQPQWKDPYMQHWSLEIQRLFGNKTMISVGYFGSKGTHLIGGYELNEVPPGKAINTLCATGASTTPTVACQVAGTVFTSSTAENILDQIRPYRGYRSITMITPQFNSNYHSLQTLFQTRLSGSSQVNVAYTWAKNLTDNQTDRSTAPQNSYDTHADYGRASLDRRHIFTANYIYDIPLFAKRHDFVGRAFGGWEISGIVTLQSGLPFSPATSNWDPAGLGLIAPPLTVARPNVLCDPNANAPHTFLQWYNTACFQSTPSPIPAFVPNVPGNGSRGAINGPPTKRFDFSLFKNIQLGRGDSSKSLQLRMEMFNVFNHTNFRGIASTNVTSTVVGQINTVRDPRTIQIGAKLFF
jgi:hypothetical protein